MTTPKRYREFTSDELTPEQKAVFDAIASTRGGTVPTPFHVLAESPQLASSAAIAPDCRRVCPSSRC